MLLPTFLLTCRAKSQHCCETEFILRRLRRSRRVTSMVESHSTSLPRITRRSALAGCAVGPAFIDGLLRVEGCSQDPVAQLWVEWKKLHQQAVMLCHKAQDLEAQLLRTVGTPIVAVQDVDGMDRAVAHSHEEIDAIFREAGFPAEAARELHQKLTALEDGWRAEGDRLGFDEAQRAEADAWAKEAEVASAIFSMAAQSLSGVQIKLALMIQMCAVGMVEPAFPLPQLQSVLNDVQKLRAR